MVLNVLGSGSSGNGYILTNDSGDSLIIELGVKWDEYLRALNYDISKVAGCLVSHC